MVTFTADGEAAGLRHAMVDAWAGQDVCSGRVEQAMRAVPRHLFLPGVPLAEAYENGIVTTHRDADGSVLSCTSVPSGVAQMLEQLDVQPGHRVLEIGAGTGINAALCAELAGPSGQVTTIDILPEAAEEARRHLIAAGYPGVRVICGDGAAGYPQGAPYDRLIVTAGAWDIPPAWFGQAGPGALIVVPLRIAGFTQVVALERDESSGGQVWRSRHSSPSGFIKMRGAGQHGERDLPIVAGGQSELRLEGDLHADQAALVNATSQPPVQQWTGVTIPSTGLVGLEMWLAELGGVCRLINRRPGHGLAPAAWASGSAAVLAATGDTFAYLGARNTGEASRELGVNAYGPLAGELADMVAGRVRAWASESPGVTTRVEVYPLGMPVPSGALLSVPKDHVRVVVRSAPRG